MDLKVYFVINVVPATVAEVVVEMISAQLLSEFWASHIVKARGSGNFRENGCKRVFCKKNNNSLIWAYSSFTKSRESGDTRNFNCNSENWAVASCLLFSLFLASSSLFRKTIFFTILGRLQMLIKIQFFSYLNNLFFNICPTVYEEL